MKPKKIGPLVIAHRGSSANAPENTFAAFRKAIDDGVEMIEIDVRMTSDFELIVIHDRNVKRTTNGMGKVSELTLRDVKRLDAGSWFSHRFRNERIPTLREVFEFLPDHVDLNIEIKTDGDARKGIAFEEACILLIREYGFVDRVTVSSFNHKFLRRLHKLTPDVAIGALYFPVRDLGKKPSTFGNSLGAHAFVCSIAQLRKGFVQNAHSHGIAIACYTVNTKKQYDKATDFGIDAIFTDYPGKMLALQKN